jgi:FlaA1/EpsC-like NDP-sugar epimerase
MSGSSSRRGRARLSLKVAMDLAAWSSAALIAFPLRVPDRWMDLGSVIGLYVSVGILLKLGLILGFELHRQVWRRVTVEDLLRLVAAVAAGTCALFLIGLVWNARSLGFPRTIPLIEGLLGLLAMAGIRVIARLWYERSGQRGATTNSGRPRRVMLIGAGSAGTRIGREIRRHPGAGMELVGFLDDDPVKASLTIAGMRVLGVLEDLPRVVKEEVVDEVLITMPAAGGRETSRVFRLAQRAGVVCRILPGITQVLSGDATLAGIREVQVEDLLRRPPVELDVPASYLEGRTVLVTGAGGSIGSELVRQVARLGPRKIVLFGHGENSLYDIQRELLATVPKLSFTVVLGDIRDRVKIDYAIETFRPEVVFHAAAHKHVPLTENNPDEAVLNNVTGTRNLAEAARAAGVQRFVNVSTDKAVHPSSMLGITKSLAERVVRIVGAQAGPDQVFVSVRFGNVLGSRGSVVPVFQAQIRSGGPLTLTDPDMTRYFMTIPEASRLVIQAGALGVNGAVYVLDMGTPVKILDLARDMIHLAGADEQDIRIVFTGVRPGEKLHEALFTDEEQLGATTYENIMMARRETEVDEHANTYLDMLTAAAERRDWQEMDRCLKVLLPGYTLGGATPVPTLPASIDS